MLHLLLYLLRFLLDLLITAFRHNFPTIYIVAIVYCFGFIFVPKGGLDHRRLPGSIIGAGWPGDGRDISVVHIMLA